MDEVAMTRLLHHEIFSCCHHSCALVQGLRQAVDFLVGLEVTVTTTESSNSTKERRIANVTNHAIEAAIAYLGTLEIFRMLKPKAWNTKYLVDDSVTLPSCELMIAVHIGDIGTVKTLLEREVTDGLSRAQAASKVLSLAVGQGDIKMFDLFLKYGASVKWGRPIYSATQIRPPCRQATTYGTPLEAACSIGHYPIIELLLDPKYGLTLADYKGIQPLPTLITLAYENTMRLEIRQTHRSSEEVHDLVQLLLTKGTFADQSDIQRDLLYEACKYGNEQLAAALIDACGRNPGGWHLYFAAEAGRLEMVKLLLARGAQRKLRFRYDALVAAAGKGHEKFVEILLTHEGLDLAHLDVDCKREHLVLQAFVDAACFGETHIMEVFLDRGLDLTARGCGQEAIDGATIIGQEGAVRLLRDKGVRTERLSLDENGNSRYLDPYGELRD